MFEKAATDSNQVAQILVAVMAEISRVIIVTENTETILYLFCFVINNKMTMIAELWFWWFL